METTNLPPHLAELSARTAAEKNDNNDRDVYTKRPVYRHQNSRGTQKKSRVCQHTVERLRKCKDSAPRFECDRTLQLRNDDSSRFGKYIKVFLDANGVVSSMEIEDYPGGATKHRLHAIF